MNEREQGSDATVVELLLHEPEIVAWLEDAPAEPDDERSGDEPPRPA